MRKHSFYLFAVILLFAVSVAAVSAKTINSSQELRFDIPFDFQVGEREFPAGHYVFRQVKDNLLFIRDDKNDVTGHSFVVTNISNLAADEPFRLTFHRYGEKLFLRAVRSPLAVVEIVKSKSEKRIQKEAKTEKLYLN